jgi:predicted nucleic acid-binding protein
VRLFLDTSVLLAAAISEKGASHEVIRLARERRWQLLTTSYVVEEVHANLGSVPESAGARWAQLRPTLEFVENILTLDRPVVFGPAKDRPILFSALAWAHVLLTLDRVDFGGLIGEGFYGLSILTPGMFLSKVRQTDPHARGVS